MLPWKILKFTVSEIAGNASDFNNHQKISSQFVSSFCQVFLKMMQVRNKIIPLPTKNRENLFNNRIIRQLLDLENAKYCDL